MPFQQILICNIIVFSMNNPKQFTINLLDCEITQRAFKLYFFNVTVTPFRLQTNLKERRRKDPKGRIYSSYKLLVRNNEQEV